MQGWTVVLRCVFFHFFGRQVLMSVLLCRPIQNSNQIFLWQCYLAIQARATFYVILNEGFLPTEKQISFFETCCRQHIFVSFCSLHFLLACRHQDCFMQPSGKPGNLALLKKRNCDRIEQRISSPMKVKSKVQIFSNLLDKMTLNAKFRTVLHI